MENDNTYGCAICGKRVDWDDVIWFNSSDGVCDECYSKIPQNILDDIEDASDYIPDNAVDWLNRTLEADFVYHNE